MNKYNQVESCELNLSNMLKRVNEVQEIYNEFTKTIHEINRKQAKNNLNELKINRN